jgi:outer membrane protein assembly factor BamB
MRASLVPLVVVLVLATGLGPVASDAPTNTGESQFQVRWVSDPPPDLASNHHTPAATYFRGEAYVAVPLNDQHGNTCQLTVLDGSGEVRWRDELDEEACTVHAVSDPTIADYDSDGQPEVLAATTEQALVAYDLRTGEPELRHNLTSYGYSKLLVANLTAAPGPETIVVDLLGGVFVLRPDGEEVWTRKLGDARVRQPAVRDFDADGLPELAVGQLSGPMTMLNHDGTTAWRTNVSESVATQWMVPGQLDDDEPVELSVATYTGHVVALDGATGEIGWDRDLGESNATAGAFLGGAGSTARTLHGVTGAAVHAAGDGDGDGQVEVYPVARNGNLYSLDGATGTVEWTTALTTGDVTVAPPPSFGDMDGDGDPELVAVTFSGRVPVVDPETGETLASYGRDRPIRTYPRLADVTGDGTPEILVIYGDGSVAALSYAPNETQNEGR